MASTLTTKPPPQPATKLFMCISFFALKRLGLLHVEQNVRCLMTHLRLFSAMKGQRVVRPIKVVKRKSFLFNFRSKVNKRD